MAVLRSPQTAVHLVTLLEEMPVQETIDAVAELRAAELPVGAVIVNMARAPLLPEPTLAAAAEGRLDRRRAARRRWPPRGLDAPSDVADALADEAAEHAERVALEQDASATTLERARPADVRAAAAARAGRPRRPVRAGRAARADAASGAA